MIKDLVSIISPCYNGEKYVVNFIESVLKQTYSHIELIIIDDGSIDKTAEIIRSYIGKFEAKQYKLQYVYQENQGQATAINRGLKLYSGEYLMWSDSDDILLPEHVERKVDFLKRHLEYGMVLCAGEIIDADNINCRIGYMERKKPKGKDTYFEDLIHERNVVFVPATIMARSEAVKKVIPEEGIYSSREGQNYQLLLPLAYSYQCGYIEEVLFQCVAHNDSHSRRKRTYEESIQRYDNAVILLLETINRIDNMPEKERRKWKKCIYLKYAERKLNLAYEKNDKKRIEEEKRQLAQMRIKRNWKCSYVGYIYISLKRMCWKILKGKR